MTYNLRLEGKKMGINITTLSENTAAAPYLLAEWGFSILVETDDINILFDTGQSTSTGFNAGTRIQLD